MTYIIHIGQGVVHKEGSRLVQKRTGKGEKGHVCELVFLV